MTRTLLAAVVLASLCRAADLPVREVILYKHGVAYFERSGELKPGETARLEFKAGDMNDVLKSLTITDRDGGKISGVRYDASEPLDKRLADFPFSVGQGSSLAAFLDQMKGSQIELGLASESVTGTIVSARSIPASDKSPARETVLLLMDSGEMRTFDLAAASAVKFPDPKLQVLLKDYLSVLHDARSKDSRAIYIDSTGSAARELAAHYMVPSPVWKSSYRLIFSGESEPTLEGWAIVDNTSGEDWSNVRLSVVSGRPISFISKLYEPRYVQRPEADLAENQPVAPVVSGGVVGGIGGGRPGGALAERVQVQAAPPPPPPRQFNAGVLTAPSSLAYTADGREEGELFEYHFPGPVTVKKGESAMLPFLQQKVAARKLLLYQENFGLHPRDAAEITNNTGKTLDGGPITVYESGAYAGEALVETFKTGDKRLISYGVDLGTRVTTAFNSSRNIVREVHFRRGLLIAKTAAQEVRTYTIRNVDAKPKTLIIEHTQRPGYNLIDQKPLETTANAYRFEVKLGASSSATFPIREERVFDQSILLSNMTPDVLTTWIQNQSLSADGRRALQQIADKKREIADNDAALNRAESDAKDLTDDQARIRSNIQSLNNVSGQQELVQQYARELAAAETKLAALRDTQARLHRTGTALQSDLDALIEKTSF